MPEGLLQATSGCQPAVTEDLGGGGCPVHQAKDQGLDVTMAMASGSHERSACHFLNITFPPSVFQHLGHGDTEVEVGPT